MKPTRDPVTTPVEWQDVHSLVFPYAAQVDGRWWVLRLNDFPDHPLYTLFVGGEVVGDIDDAPRAWKLRGGRSLPPGRRDSVLALMRGLGPYGAEVGRPCDGDFCHCSALTDELASRPHDPPGGPPTDSAPSSP